MTTNHKHYESIPSHNVESQALIADEVIEQGFSPRRHPFVILFLGIALATIAVGLSMFHQTSPSGAEAITHCMHDHECGGEEYYCKLGRVQNHCSKYRLIGEPCHSPNECASGTCSEKRCSPFVPRAYNESCKRNDQCASRECNSGRCTFAF